ncbi:MAG: hypothetical protein K0R54_432 [Clostridiaceae bacterium]|jgi:hypothetical protein|nr:hypothetical protein [Clostridiaceae bacterium]
MNNNGICNQSQCNDYIDECIMALKVYDSCTQQDCLTSEMLSPIVSAEKFSCTILENPPFGQLISPGCSVIPTTKSKDVKILNNSFKICNIEILSICPCYFPQKGYWVVELKYNFIFKLQFFDCKGNVIKISCSESNDLCDSEILKDYIEACTSYIKKVKLFGAVKTNVTTVSNIFKPNTTISNGGPFVEASGTASPLKMETEIMNPLCEDPCNPPKIKIKIYIGLFTIIRLLRFVSLMLKCSGFCYPKIYCSNIPDLCSDFNTLKFPYNKFNP